MSVLACAWPAAAGSQEDGQARSRTSPTKPSSRSSRAVTTTRSQRSTTASAGSPTGSPTGSCATSKLAEDAVQEGFLAVWRAAAAFRPERAKASTWIVTLVHRRAVDIVRREERRRAEPLEADSHADAADPAGSAEDGGLARVRARPRPGRAARAAGRAARDDRARLLRRLLAVRAGRAARSAARDDQEQDVRRARAAARGPGRRRIRGIMDAEAHELIAGYALDALDEADRARAKELLATSEEAREELRAFTDVAAAHGDGRVGARRRAPSFVTASSSAARSEPQNVVSLDARRRLRAAPVLGVAAAVAACAAVASRRLGPHRVVGSRRRARGARRASAPPRPCSPTRCRSPR